MCITDWLNVNDHNTARVRPMMMATVMRVNKSIDIRTIKYILNIFK